MSESKVENVGRKLSIESGWLSGDWGSILKLALPEFLSATLLVFLPIAFDLYFVSSMKHTISYQALGLSTNVLHLLSKMSEAVAVSVSTRVGFLNGAEKYGDAGNFFINACIAAFILGLCQMFLILICSHTYCLWIGAPVDVIPLARGFMHTYGIAIFLSFLFMCLVGFYRGTRNATIPLYSNILAAALFLVFAYIFIFGKMGMPAMGLQGSAIASIFRDLGANLFLLGYLIFSDQYGRFFSRNSFVFDPEVIWSTVAFVIPIMIDKSVIAVAYIWLYKLVIPLGTYSLLALEVIKNFERLIFVPVHALAHVVNVTVSNDVGARDYPAAWKNIKRILLVAVVTVTVLLAVVSVNANPLVAIFDPQDLFREETVFIFRCISGLVILDVFQVVFASALRAVGCVYTVMITRISFFVVFYLPASYFIKTTSLVGNNKFLTYYFVFYLTIALIGLFFLHRINVILRLQEQDVNV